MGAPSQHSAGAEHLAGQPHETETRTMEGDLGPPQRASSARTVSPPMAKVAVAMIMAVMPTRAIVEPSIVGAINRSVIAVPIVRIAVPIVVTVMAINAADLCVRVASGVQG